jgi:ABC-type amino acid transport substrate-binding protein
MAMPVHNFRAALAAALLLASGARRLGAEDLDAIRARGTLRVIFGSYGMPEAITLQPGAPPGLEREMIEGFAALHRLKVEFVPVETSGERIPALLAKKGDIVVGGLGVTEERRKVVDFTVEVFPSRHLVVTHRPHPPIETLEQLRKVRVGTTKGSSWAETVAAAGIPPENLDLSFTTPEEVLEALRGGKVTAVVMAVGWALLEKRKDPQIELGMFMGAPNGRAWAVHKDAPELRKALDEYVANIRRSSTWHRLVIKYYGELALEVLKRARAVS